MEQITLNKKDMKNLLEYINKVFDLVDTESMPCEDAEIIIDGYYDFVEPILKTVYEC